MQNPHSSNLTFETLHGSVGSDQELPKFSNSNSKENLKSPRVANSDAWARLIGPHNIAPLKVENFERLMPFWILGQWSAQYLNLG